MRRGRRIYLGRFLVCGALFRLLDSEPGEDGWSGDSYEDASSEHDDHAGD